MRFLLLCFIGLISFTISANIIEVCNQCTCSTLKSALTIAKPFDTLMIKKGNYACVNETISKPLTLIGEGYPVLDGQSLDDILVVSSNAVKITGLTIANSKCGSMKDYCGIRVFKSSAVQIENCILKNTFFGIYLSDSKNITISNCSSKGAHYGKSDTGNGIHLWKSDSINIINNRIEGHRDGIYLEFAKMCNIERNLCFKNFRYGLHFMFSDNDSYIQNTFSNNGTGVAVMYSKGVRMLDNTFSYNWGDAAYGLLLKDMNNGIIIGNKFNNNTVGITMEGGTNMHFERNNFRENGYALKVMANCRLDTFVGNNFSGNTFDASTNGELKENLFEKNYWDKYEGYDLNKDELGDIPYRPVSLYAVLIDQMPFAVMLMRSFTIDLLNRVERNIPSLIPVTFVDEKPLMKMTIQK